MNEEPADVAYETPGVESAQKQLDQANVSAVSPSTLKEASQLR